MTHEQMIEMAEAMGFSAAAVVETQNIPFDASFRPLCEENLCGKYGVNYACPPDCGTPEEMERKLKCHRHALVLQTIWQVDDYSDSKQTGPAKAEHNAMSQRLMRALREQGCAGFMVGSGGCSLCKPCAIVRGEPCIFPDLCYSCMSAYCVNAQKMADFVGMKCWENDGKIRYFSLILF